MSASALLNPVTGKILSQYIPASPTTIGSLATPILPPAGAVSAPVTGTFNCPQTGNYLIQMYFSFVGAGVNVGSTPSGYTYTGSDGWGNNSVTPASLSTGGFQFVFTTVGQINAGVQTFTFTPGTGLNTGASGEVAVRVIGPVVG